MYRVFLGLGSNLGDRAGLLNRAASAIAGLRETRMIWSSSVYETEPFGRTDQPKFLNAVLEVETELSPAALLAAVKDVETRLGRQSREQWGPREIDVDILMYDGLVQNDDVVHVPHPGLPARRFVLIPLREIAPDLVHPVSGMTVEEMAAACSDVGRVVKTQFRIHW
jgi:2-amino-4-hydroxy-6-hydroxymethyldihydropteridine diphosphokinase